MFVSFQGITDAEEPVKPRWYGGQDSYLAVWGEYEPVRGSWTFRRDVLRADSYHRDRYPDEGTMTAKIRVWGKSSARYHRYRPNRWFLSIHMGRHRSVWETSGSCKSLTDAVHKADAAMTDEVVRECLQKVYQHSHHMESVYRLRKEAEDEVKGLSSWRFKEDKKRKQEIFEDPNNWEPWLTSLGIEWSHWDWPSGHHFLSFNSRGEGWIHDHSGSCISSSGIRVPPAERFREDTCLIDVPYFSRQPKAT